jgi:hypothetical protein
MQAKTDGNLPLPASAVFETHTAMSSVFARWTERIAEWLVRARWVLLVVGIVGTVAATPSALQLDFDAQLESLFSAKDQLLQDYLQSIRTFGGDEVIVMAYRDPQLLTVAGLERLQRVADAVTAADRRLVEELQVAEEHAVQSVAHLAASPRPSKPLSTDPLLAQIRRQPVAPDKLADELLRSELHRDVLLGRDGQTTALIVTLVPDMGKGKQRRKYVVLEIKQAIRDALSHDGIEPRIAGGPVLVHQAVEYLDEDGYKFLYGTTGLLIIVIALLFRSLRWVAVPLAVVHATLIWTKAILNWSGVQLTMISSILTAMVTVIGIATVIHTTVRYREERRTRDPLDALRRTLILMGPPTFWTSATTGGGFGALMICEIAPVRTFGLMMCLGSMLVWLVGAILLPGLALLPGLGGDPSDAPGEAALGRYLGGILDHVERRPLLVGAAGIGVLVVLTLGWLRLRIETDFTHNFRESSEVVVASRFIEQNLSGSGVLEVTFTAPHSLSQEEIDRLRRLETGLRGIAGITKVIGLVDLLDFLDQGARSRGGIGGLLGSALTRLPLAAKITLLQSSGASSPFWKPKANRMRVMLRASERATSHEKDRVIREAEALARRELGAARDPKVTGYYVLLNHLVSRLLYDQRNTFALASAICLVMMVAAFRDWRLGLIAMVPNAVPIIMVVGAMGWLGLPVNMATAMLSSVSIGMAVDSTIHYLYHFRRERQAGLDFDTALQRTHHEVGRALSFANLAIVVGFSALVTSHFIPTIHFGILVSIALLGGLVGNLVVLPLLMRLPVLRLREA